MTDSRAPSSDDSDSSATRVDLGDDLLKDTTVIFQRDALSQESAASPKGEVDDLLQSAKILVSEGLLEEAKKVLRQILIHHPLSSIAQQTLEEIQGLELKQIFRGSDVLRSYSQNAEQRLPQQEWGGVDSEALMRQLDHDLDLGIFKDRRSSQRSSQGFGKQGVSSEKDQEVGSKDYESSNFLLWNEERVSAYVQLLEKSLAGGSARDWIDLGIAFLEMDLYEISVRLFMGACRKVNPSSPEAGEVTLSATCLLALALVKSDRPFEALSRIQPLLQDVEIKSENKVELFYLMARTYESLKKFDFAHQCYRRIMDIDPKYRDTLQRLRSWTKAKVKE